MSFLLSSHGRLLELFVLCGALWTIEAVLPLQRYAGSRARHAWPNLGLTALLVVMNLVLSFGAAAIVVLADERGLGLRLSLPAWASLIVALVALDALAYVAHRLLHATAIGWRFHRVHHSDAHVDVTTAFRQHPGETIWRMVWQVAGTLALGLPAWTVVIYLIVSAANAELEHANIRVAPRLDRVLRLVVVTPNVHKVHHSRQRNETDSNYSNILSVWDRLFGTFHAPADVAALQYGLDDVSGPRAETLAGLLALPFAYSGEQG